MAKFPCSINVVDVESTCWEGEPPVGEKSEIIEVGISLLVVSTNPVIAESQGYYVQTERSKVSEFCTSLTGITQEQVDGGMPLVRVCNLLKKYWFSEERTFASWGDYDRVQFQRCCEAQGIKYPFGPTHLNVKNLFALRYNLGKEVGLDRAFEIVREQHSEPDFVMEGRHHSGRDDAYNIARILARLL